MRSTVGFVSLGCAKNQVDTEGIIGLLRQEGFDYVSDIANADCIVINTCCFITPAKEESIETILELAQYKSSRCRNLAVIGCLVQRYGDELKKLIPEVDFWLGTGEYDRLPQLLKEQGETGRVYCENKGWLQKKEVSRVRTTPNHWAYLKVADGCNNRCTYCVIPSVRGDYKSRSLKDIVDETATLVEQGVKEINLIAQDITAFGSDSSSGDSLIGLLQEMDAIQGDFWIRLLYAYPTRVTQPLLKYMAQSQHILHYIDLPMQHVEPVILERMGRGRTAGILEDLIGSIREAMPDAAIRSTFILGFPGETEEAFRELMDFIKRTQLDWVGAFPYSREEGTPASNMRPLVHPATKERRVRELMQAQALITEVRLRRLVGGKIKILVEEASSKGGWGRAYLQAPEVDGKIYFSEAAKPGEFRLAKITEILPPYDLQAVLEK